MTSHHDIRFSRRRSLSLLFATALAAGLPLPALAESPGELRIGY